VGVAVLFWGIVSLAVRVATTGLTYYPDQDWNGDDSDDHQDE
jgi:hypothetical protein